MSLASLRVASAAVAAALLAGCGGSGGIAPQTPFPTQAPVVTPTKAPASAPNSVTAPIANGAVVSIPPLGGISGTIGFPASGVPAGETITLTALASAPAGVPATVPASVARRLGDAVRRPSAAGTVSLIPPFTTFTFPAALTLPSSPPFSFDLPAAPPAGDQIVGVGYDLTGPNAPIAVFIASATVSGTNLSFPAVAFPAPGLTFNAGDTYFFAIYDIGGASATASPTASPTASATASPTASATALPTASPTAPATASPTASPATPTPSPSASSASSMPAILAAGGTLDLPAYGGFSGSLAYPSNDAPAGTTATLVSSTSNLGTLPTPSGGTILFYEQLTLNGSAPVVTFDAGTGGASLTSTALLSTKTYTLYEYVVSFGMPQLVGSTNVGSPSNGTLAFASPISGIQLPPGVPVVLEIGQN